MSSAVRCELRTFASGFDRVLVETVYDAHGSVLEVKVKTKSTGTQLWSKPLAYIGVEHIRYGDPEPRTCPRCGGEGAVDSSEDVGPSGMVTCPRCYGEGVTG